MSSPRRREPGTLSSSRTRGPSVFTAKSLGPRLREDDNVKSLGPRLREDDNVKSLGPRVREDDNVKSLGPRLREDDNVKSLGPRLREDDRSVPEIAVLQRKVVDRLLHQRNRRLQVVALGA